jgi:hypothetical protein
MWVGAASERQRGRAGGSWGGPRAAGQQRALARRAAAATSQSCDVLPLVQQPETVAPLMPGACHRWTA